jgi:hypothetical protein
MTAEANEIIAALQVALPTSKPRVVAEEVIACQSLGKFGVVAVEGLRMP